MDSRLIYIIIKSDRSYVTSILYYSIIPLLALQYKIKIYKISDGSDENILPIGHDIKIVKKLINL